MKTMVSLGILISWIACLSLSAEEEKDKKVATPAKKNTELITLGAGCFWCVEAVLDKVEGIESAISGYMGGQTANPTYKEICKGDTGHAEVINVTFDPKEISIEEVFDIFWKVHDPTTLNRQGNDIGTQYRSGIFYHSEAQKKAAEASLKKAQSKFKDPIVTEITPASQFYFAEAYHQDYFINNPGNPYCRAVVPAKMKKVFGDKK